MIVRMHPLRGQSSRSHLYNEQQMRRLRVVVLLRDAGCDALALFQRYVSEFRG